MKVTPVKKKWIDVVNSELGAGSVISRTQVQEFMKKYDLKWPTYFMSGPYVVSKGKYITQSKISPSAFSYPDGEINDNRNL